MKLDYSQVGDVAVLEFTGEFDAFNLVPVSKAVDEVIDRGEARLVFNLHKLTFINSSALGYLLKARKKALAAGGDVVLVQPSKFIRKLLSTLGLEKIFSIYDTQEMGVRHYVSKRPLANAHVGDEIDESLTGANAILFTLVGSATTRKYVGRITSLYADGLKFRWEVPGWTREYRPPLSTANFDKEVHPGNKLHVKFRQPFMVQGHHFEMDATVAHVSRDVLDDGRNEAVFNIKYVNAAAQDLAMLRRFVDDMAQFRAEIDEAGR